MDTGKILIQTILVVALAVPAIIILLPTKGARGLAIRRITLLGILLGGIVAIVFPEITNWIANLLGVGRGADLLLYGLIIVFLATTLSTASHLRRADRQISELTRVLALARAEPPVTDASAR